MYAVIQTGGKQYRAQVGEIIQIEKLEGTPGTSVKFGEVLFASKLNGEKSSEIFLGKPLLDGASVEAEIVGQGRDEKIVTIKMKRRKGYRKVQGHRQYQTQVLITAIDAGKGAKANLSDADKKKALESFQSHLKPKGPASTTKTLGSRARMAAQTKGKGEAAATPKKRTAKRASGQTKKRATKVAAKKAAPKKTARKKTAAKKKTATTKKKA